MTSTTRNIIWLFGFISGFNLLITSNSLNFWLAKEGINLKVIGFFSFVSLPYAVNFLWAPMIDHLNLGKWGRRVGKRPAWAMLLLVCTVGSSLALSYLDPIEQIEWVAVLAFIVAFFTSSLDTVLGAMRSEILKYGEHGSAAGGYIVGYRLGMLASGSGAIYLSSIVGWNVVYQIFAGIMCLFVAAIYYYRKRLKTHHDLVPEHKLIQGNKGFIIGSVLAPLGSTLFVVFLVLFLVLYRMPDNFISTMINSFVLYIGFNEQEIATAGKFWGIIGSIIGGIAASKLMQKWSIYISLLRFGMIHAFSHLSYIALNIYGKSISLLFFVTGFESITGGMAMAAYIALITSLCRGKYRATQYSFLSSMMGFSRSILPSVSGILVLNYGWDFFFMLSSLLTLPALMLIGILYQLADNPEYE